MAVVVRDAIELDWPELWPLLAAMGKVGPPDGVATRFRLALDAADQLLCVAIRDEHVVGYAWAQDRGAHLRSGRRTVRLNDLFVLPECRRSGVGRQLFERSVAWAKARGARWIEWQASSDAVGFYERLGLRSHPDPDPEHPYFEIELRS
jgi:GNAT superfamily N-acetyltransferase